jgi:hypothetical protein
MYRVSGIFARMRLVYIHALDLLFGSCIGGELQWRDAVPLMAYQRTNIY